LRFEFLLPFSFEKVILSVLPAYQTEIYDPNVTVFEDLGHTTYEELIEKGYKLNSKRSMSKTNCNISLGFPFKYRKGCSVTTYIYNPENKTLLQITKGCPLKKGDKMDFSKNFGQFYDKKKNILFETEYWNVPFINIFLYQKLDENRTFVSQNNLVDLGGIAGNKKICNYNLLTKQKNYLILEVLD
jgi:hypothetical protein